MIDAEQDLLTGFHTAESFERIFAEQLALSVEKETPLAVALIDIDNFRTFNESRGTGLGNAVLRNLAALVLTHLPPGATAGRYGGEEFILLFPNTERETVFLLIEKIRSLFDVEADISDGANVIRERVTLSGGIAAHPSDGATAPEILRKVEQALYRAKVHGRNRICMAQEEKMIPKTAHFTATQLERLAQLAQREEVPEALLLREALDCLLRKYTVAKREC